MISGDFVHMNKHRKSRVENFQRRMAYDTTRLEMFIIIMLAGGHIFRFIASPTKPTAQFLGPIAGVSLVQMPRCWSASSAKSRHGSPGSTPGLTPEVRAGRSYTRCYQDR